MNPTSSTEIESIVQLVIERLRGNDSARGNRQNSPVTRIGTGPSTRPEIASETLLQLTGKVISFRDVEGRLSGVNRIRVREDAVITPSVRDELVRWKVSIERLAISNDEKHGPCEVAHQHILDFCLTIIVSEAKSQTLRRVAPSCDFWLVKSNQQCSQVVQSLLSAWTSRHHWVWYTDQPYAASAAISERANPQLRSVILVDLDELDVALGQAKPNLLIIDEKRWTSFQVSRLTNQWSQLLRQR